MEQFENNPSRNKQYDSNLLYTEPEVEEFCEDNELKKFFESIGIDYSSIANLKSISHDANDLDCIHCKIQTKINDLHSSISSLSKELTFKEQILKLKKSQNADIRTIIETLDTNIPYPLKISEINLEASEKTCSCSKTCSTF